VVLAEDLVVLIVEGYRLQALETLHQFLHRKEIQEAQMCQIQQYMLLVAGEGQVEQEVMAVDHPTKEVLEA
jgi:gamma-glutamylcyclotransferase (GGCT)/AIG2-like uncharacterized protein YtfP